MPKVRIKELRADPKRCSGCNWDTYNLYFFDNETEEKGLCAECFLDFVFHNEMEINCVKCDSDNIEFRGGAGVTACPLLTREV